MSAERPKRPKPVTNEEFFFGGTGGSHRFKEFADNVSCGRCLAEQECDRNPRAYKYPGSWQCSSSKMRWLRLRAKLGPEQAKWREGRCGTL